MNKVLLIVGIVLILGGLGGGYWGYYEYWQHAAGYESEANAARREGGRGSREKVEESEEMASRVKGEAYTRWGASGGAVVLGVVLIVLGARKKKPLPQAA